jgi:hypothetical protein
MMTMTITLDIPEEEKDKLIPKTVPEMIHSIGKMFENNREHGITLKESAVGMRDEAGIKLKVRVREGITI